MIVCNCSVVSMSVLLQVRVEESTRLPFVGQAACLRATGEGEKRRRQAQVCVGWRAALRQRSRALLSRQSATPAWFTEQQRRTLLPPTPVVRDDAGGRPGHRVAGQVLRRDRQVIDAA